ncbi:MAG: phosphodiester glycosidase family protein [Myxococcales bacterium]|nr:phosphodiester glycosidase family protein [Myxococcales bacterium]
MSKFLVSITIVALTVAGVYAWLVQPPSEPTAPALHLEAIRRTSQRPGLEVLEAKVYERGAFRGRMVVLYADLLQTHPTLILNPHEKPLQALMEDNMSVANAGYFTRKRRPTGLLISEGQQLHPFIRTAGGAGSGVLMISEQQIRLVERDHVTAEHLQQASFAIQAGPRVIESDGQPGIHSDDGQRANRTVIGYDAQQRLAIGVVYGADAGIGSGLTLYELQKIIGQEGLGRIDPSLNFEAALNLDGGPSTGFHTQVTNPPIDLPPVGSVVSVLRIYHPPPTDTVPNSTTTP